MSEAPKYGFKAFVFRNGHAHAKHGDLSIQYQPDQIYEIAGPLQMCHNGFHYCTELTYIFNYYTYNSVVALIEILGDVLEEKKETASNCKKHSNNYSMKYCTNKYRIVRWLNGTVKTQNSEYTFKKGMLHSSNNIPAYVNSEIKIWFKKGLRHREGDLPAVERSDGAQEWYFNGKLHRENDAPASIEPARGMRSWWHHGEQYKEKSNNVRREI